MNVWLLASDDNVDAFSKPLGPEILTLRDMIHLVGKSNFEYFNVSKVAPYCSQKSDFENISEFYKQMFKVELNNREEDEEG